MAVFYSPSLGGFFDSAIHADMPDDVVEIGTELHQSLLAGQSQGWRIVPGAGGVPELAEQLPPSVAQLWAALQSQAQAAIDASDITLLRCVEHGVPVPAEWVAYRAALRSIVRSATGDPTQGLPARPAYPAGT